MSAISLKSITGITSITTPAGVDNQLTLHTNDTSEKLRITSEGKLGVNYNNPSTIIHAIGNNTVGTSVTMTLQSHDTINATAGINLLARRLDNTNETCKIQAASDGQNSVDLQFHTNSNERLRISSAGLVGIGLTNPEVRLHVQGTGTEIAHFSGANNAELKLRNATSNVFLIYSGTGDTLQLGTNGQNVGLNIDTNQNITNTGNLTGYSFNNDTSNAKIFEVTGAGTDGKYGIINISGNTNSNNGAVGNLRFVNRENSAATSAGSANSRGLAAIQAYAVTTDSNAGDDSGGYLTFLTKGDGQSLSTKAVLKETGHFGLGDTTPDTRLSVTAATGTDVVAKFKSTDQYAYIQLRDSTTADTAVMLGADGDNLMLRAGSDQRLRILSSGETCIRDVDLILGYDQNTHAALNFFANTDNASGRYARIRKNYNSPFNLEYFASTSASDQNHVFYSDLTTERVRFHSTGSVSIGDAATHTFSAHSEGDDLVVGGAGWRGMTIYGEGGGGVIQFADNADNRVGQILYYHAENSMSFRVNGNQTRLKIDSNGDVCIGNSGNPPWTETGGNYNNISLCGNDASSSGFLNLGNGAAATNADFDLARIKIHNGSTEVARIATTTATSANDDGHLKFFTKKTGQGLKEVLRIRNDGFIETMYEENQQSYAHNISPTPCIRARNNRAGNGIYAGIQFFNLRSSGAASVADIGVVNDASTDYVSYLTFTTRNSDTTYSEKIRIDDAGQIRYQYANNGKHAFAVRSQERTITGHSSTGYQYVRCALLSARTAYRFCISTRGGNYGPGAQFFTALRSWDNTTFYVTDKFNMGSAYANAVRMQSDNGGSTWYLEVSINLTTTSQGFELCVIPIGGNAGTMTTTLQYYGSGMSNLANTSSAQSL